MPADSTSDPNPSPAPPPGADRLGGDAPMPCIGCGYDLRGLLRDQPCPECATPVERSLRSDALADAHPDWRRRIARGLTLISVAPGIMIGAFVLVAVTAILSAILSWPGGVVNAIEAAIEYVLYAASGLAIVGGVLATWLEPRESEIESSRSPRRLARLGLAATLAVIGARIAWDRLAPAATLVPDEVFVLATTLCLGAFSLAFGRWVGGLLRRVPELELAVRTEKHGLFFAWAPIAFIAYVTLEEVFSTLAQRGITLPGTIARVLEVGWTLLGCGAGILGIWLLVRCVTVWIVLARAARAVRLAASPADDPLGAPLPTGADAAQAVYPPPPGRSEDEAR